MAALQMMDDTTDITVARLLNYNNAAEGGKTIPPRQHGDSRVPSVSSLAITKTQQQATGTVFTLSWIDPKDDASQPIDHYNIYTTKYIDNNASPVALASSSGAPATIFVPADGLTPVTFTVQTVLANGTTSSLKNAPTVSGVAGIPDVATLSSLQIQPLAITTGVSTLPINTFTDVLNVSPDMGGVLITIGLTLTSTPAAQNNTTELVFSVDGSPAESYIIFDKDTTVGFNHHTRAIASQVIGTGLNIGDTITFQMSTSFLTSCHAQVHTEADGSGGGFTFDVTVLYSFRVS